MRKEELKKVKLNNAIFNIVNFKDRNTNELYQPPPWTRTRAKSEKLS